MLQRIQTVHFAITMLLFSALFAGLDLLKFELQAGEKIRTIDVFGRATYTQTNAEKTLVANESIPLFMAVIAMILLLFITLMAYKNVHRQLSLARISMLINAILVFLLVVWSTYLFVTAQQTPRILCNLVFTCLPVPCLLPISVIKECLKIKCY